MKLLVDIILLLMLPLFGQCNDGQEGLNLNFLQDDYQVKFERVELVRYNKAIWKSFSVRTFKYNRTTAVINATFTPKIDIGYDLEAVTQANTFMSNEYRQFPLRFAANACKAVKADVAGIHSMKCGNFTGCPLTKEHTYHVCNWQPNQSKCPPFIPNGQYKMEVQFFRSSVEVLALNMYATVSRPIV